MQLRVLIVLLTLTPLGHRATAWAQISRRGVTVSSLQTTFVTKGFFRGTVEVYPESVVVAFDSTYIVQAEEQPGRSAYHVDSVSVGLATATSGDGWDIYSGERSMLVADSLAERPVFSLGPMRFHISRVPSKALSRSWVVVTFYQIVAPRLVPRTQQATGTTYAHSDRQLFSGL